MKCSPGLYGAMKITLRIPILLLLNSHFPFPWTLLTFNSSSIQSPNATVIAKQRKSPFLFFFLLYFSPSQSILSWYQSGQTMRSLPAVFPSHHFCSWGGSHWPTGVRYQSTEQMWAARVLGTGYTHQQQVPAMAPLWHRIVTSAMRGTSVLCYKPGKARKAGMCNVK